MSRHFSSAHIACHCMVVFFGTSLALNLIPWRSRSTIFSGESGSFQKIATPELVLHKVACLDSVFNRLVRLSDRFSRKTCESKSYLLHDSFTLFYTSALTPVGSNHCTAHKHLKLYFEEDLICADFVRYLHINNSTVRDLDIESMIQTIYCD